MNTSPHVPNPNLEDQKTAFVRPLTIDQPGMRDCDCCADTTQYSLMDHEVTQAHTTETKNSYERTTKPGTVFQRFRGYKKLMSFLERTIEYSTVLHWRNFPSYGVEPNFLAIGKIHGIFVDRIQIQVLEKDDIGMTFINPCQRAPPFLCRKDPIRHQVSFCKLGLSRFVVSCSPKRGLKIERQCELLNRHDDGQTALCIMDFRVEKSPTGNPYRTGRGSPGCGFTYYMPVKLNSQCTTHKVAENSSIAHDRCRPSWGWLIRCEIRGHLVSRYGTICHILIRIYIQQLSMIGAKERHIQGLETEETCEDEAKEVLVKEGALQMGTVFYESLPAFLTRSNASFRTSSLSKLTKYAQQLRRPVVRGLVGQTAESVASGRVSELCCPPLRGLIGLMNGGTPCASKYSISKHELSRYKPLGTKNLSIADDSQVKSVNLRTPSITHIMAQQSRKGVDVGCIASVHSHRQHVPKTNINEPVITGYSIESNNTEEVKKLAADGSLRQESVLLVIRSICSREELGYWTLDQTLKGSQEKVNSTLTSQRLSWIMSAVKEQEAKSTNLSATSVYLDVRDRCESLRVTGQLLATKLGLKISPPEAAVVKEMAENSSERVQLPDSVTTPSNMASEIVGPVVIHDHEGQSHKFNNIERKNPTYTEPVRLISDELGAFIVT
ncbi:hypothetical protein CLF_104367 [Clonorchis sinensis]|uniref:Uncharacterized protein n=1 Tax=Clonorchis sinensis TaxID=79923 RepID=G7YBI3_CLOSI|nr:hypothetical protein CLF_104367 [Clonorchis sinensis]